MHSEILPYVSQHSKSCRVLAWYLLRFSFAFVLMYIKQTKFAVYLLTAYIKVTYKNYPTLCNSQRDITLPNFIIFD